MKHTFIEILRALSRARVRALVAGGVAVILHGVVRTTQDLDLYVELSRANVLRLVRALKVLGYQPRVPVSAEALADRSQRLRWIREKGMLVFSFIDPRHPLHPVDIFVRHLIPFTQVWRRRQMIEIEGDRIALLSIRDLVTLKKAAGREQDLADIRSLKRYEAEQRAQAKRRSPGARRPRQS